MKQINEYLEVGYCQCGQPLTAEHLSKWAYNQLSAAPDLLEACKDAYKLIALNRPDTCGYVLVKLSDAIAKAEGEK